MKKFIHKLFLMVACQLGFLNVSARLPEDNCLRRFAEKANSDYVLYDQDSQKLFLKKELRSQVSSMGKASLVSWGFVIGSFVLGVCAEDLDRRENRCYWASYIQSVGISFGVLGLVPAVVTSLACFGMAINAQYDTIIIGEEGIYREIASVNIKCNEIESVSMTVVVNGPLVEKAIKLSGKFGVTHMNIDNMPINITELVTILNSLVKKQDIA